MIPTRMIGPAALDCYRVITPVYAGTPKSGMGAANKGGRFNRPGQEALYLSMDQPTALAEYKQDNPWLQPGTICTFFVNSLNFADLSAGYDPARWPVLWASYTADWRNLWFDKKIVPPTWDMADEVLALGLDGIIFPSQALHGGVNLVVYDSSSRAASELDVYDPDGNLAKIRPSGP